MAKLKPPLIKQLRRLAIALGVSLLHKLLLEELIFKAAGGEPKFQYVHRLDETTTALNAKTHQLGCLVAPATIEHVREIAAGRETMPPKSTYFYPKLLSGMAVSGHSLASVSDALTIRPRNNVFWARDEI